MALLLIIQTGSNTVFTGNLIDRLLILNGLESHLCLESAITPLSMGHGGKTPFFFLAFPSLIFAQMMTILPVGMISYSTV